MKLKKKVINKKKVSTRPKQIEDAQEEILG